MLRPSNVAEKTVMPSPTVGLWSNLVYALRAALVLNKVSESRASSIRIAGYAFS